MTITLKNIPAQLHRVLKLQARHHKRSLNQEAILCLEKAVGLSVGRPTLAEPPPPASAGSIIRQLGSRAEMLEDFMERGS